MMGKDKILHATVCCIVAAGVAWGFRATGCGRWHSAFAGLIAGLAIGVGKEYGDNNAPGNRWSWGDVLADAVGAMLGGASALI